MRFFEKAFVLGLMLLSIITLVVFGLSEVRECVIDTFESSEPALMGLHVDEESEYRALRGVQIATEEKELH